MVKTIMILFAVFCLGAVSYCEGEKEETALNDVQADLSVMASSLCCMEPDEYRPPVIRLVYGSDMCCLEPDNIS